MLIAMMHEKFTYPMRNLGLIKPEPKLYYIECDFGIKTISSNTMYRIVLLYLSQLKLALVCEKSR